MKKLIYILLLCISVSAFAQSTDAELTTQANVIRNETIPGANTPLRIGNMFRALIDSKKNIDEAYTSTGAANTYSVTINPGVTGFTKDFGFYWKVNVTNTGATTLSPNGLAAKSVRKNGTAALQADDIVAGRIYPVVYDVAQGWFQILLPGTGGGGGATAFTDLTDVPGDYTGQANKVVSVKTDETGLEFTTSVGVTDGDKGDITVTGTGATWTIDNLVVTPAKMSTLSSAELAGKLTDETGTGVSVFSASPALTGAPTAPTPSPADNSTKIATTAYVDAAVGGGGAVSSVFGRTGVVTAQSGDYTGTQVTNTPAGTIAATTTQAAVNELDAEKWNTAGSTTITTPTITGIPTFAGNAIIQTDGLGVTQVDNSGLALTNTTAATVSLNQYSPALRFRGNGWKTNATAASQAVEFRQDLLTATGAISPGGRLRWMASVNGGSYEDVMYLDTDGFDPTGGGLTVESQSDANGAVFNQYYNQSVPAVNDRITETHSYSNDSGGNKTQYTAIYSEIASPTDGAEGGIQLMNLTSNGALRVHYRAEPSGTFSKTTVGEIALFDRNGYGVSFGENIGTANTGFRYAKTTSGRLPFVFANTTTAVGSYAEVNVTNDLAGTFSEGLRMIKFTDNWVSLGAYKTDGACIEAGSGLAGGLALTATHAGGVIRFYTANSNNTNEWLNIGTTGTVTMGGTAATGTTRTILADGTETNIDLTITAKGTGGVNVEGSGTNDNASSGYVGEELNSAVSTYTNYTTTATYQNIASITLTAGDWDLSAFFTYSTNSATTTSGADALFVISTTTASSAGATEGVNIAYIAQAGLLSTSHFSDAITPYRVSISASTTYYLNTQATFIAGNPQYVGSIRARRMR